ncbi:MAG: TetR/AcrR family transcriptional regulator [Bacteroidaceae bacterium]
MEINNTISDTQERVRLHILATAMNAFSTHGIRPVTMDIIARSMKISKRTIYAIFEDKEALLLEGIRVHKLRMQEHMKEFSQKNDNVLEVILHFFECSMEELRQTCPQFHTDIKRYPRVFEEMHKQRALDSENTVAFLEKGVEQGIFRSDVRLDIVYTLLAEALENAMLTTMANVPPELILSTILPVWIRGISTDKGLTILENFLLCHRLGEGSTSDMNVFSIAYLEDQK